MCSAGEPRYGLSMSSRLAQIWLRFRTGRALDGFLVAAIGGGALLEIALLTDPRHVGWGGPRGVASALALMSSVPLFWRRKHPLLALAVIDLSLVPIVALCQPVQGPFEPFVALMVGAFSAGIYAPALRGLALSFAPWIAGVPAVMLGYQSGDIVYPAAVWIGAAWIVGRVVRSRQQRAVELEALAEELDVQREVQAKTAVVHERARIARELHDVIAHNVSMIVVQAGAAARVLEGDQPHVRDALGAIEQTGRETVDEMRRLLGVLRRADDELALAPQPTLRQLDELVAHVREAGLPVDLHVEGTAGALPPGVDLSAYRIVQEALTNALKHAGPARARVTVRYVPNAVEIEVCDDGGGGRNGGAGHGLVGMRERVSLFGGELEAGRSAEGGYAVRARLPVG
jgi:signal transduction histidine kinase